MPWRAEVEAIAELLEESADRSVLAIDTLRGDIAELRRTMDRDRAATGARLGLVETQIDRYAVRLAEALEELDELDRRCQALVVTRNDGGEVTTVSARVGLDTKYVIGLVVTLVTAAIVPVLIAILASGGGP